MTINIQSANNSNAYDEVPYESYPYSASSPSHLMAIGTLFGMKPTALDNARILELGCASGGNIIQHAINYPKAEIVGVDLSKVQIDEANVHKEKLGLKNINFKNCSITDIDSSFGKFDYIICHGVISWVPDFVRDKIFDVCQNNLTENGIAYVSYNTLPGWNMIRSIRDMMLYHTKGFTDPKEKVGQARLLLKFIDDSLEGSKTPYADVLKQETELLSKHADHYLMHDHLEDNNTQYYFKDFIEEATKRDLQYLADSSLSSMFLQNMPPLVVEKLKSLNDIVRSEQYMDFITNRRFRMTLLCHKNAKISRTINNEDIKKFNLLFKIQPEKPLAEINIEDPLENIKFHFNGSSEANIGSTSPYMKAILYSFSENINNPLSFDQLIKLSAKKLKDSNKVTNLNNELINNAMRLLFQGYISITMDCHKEYKLDKPKVSKMIAYQVSETNNLWVTNLRHEVIGINIFDKYALRYMNGKNSKEQIIDNIVQHIKSNELNLNRDGVKIEDPYSVMQDLNEYLDATINKAAANAFLE